MRMLRAILCVSLMSALVMPGAPAYAQGGPGKEIARKLFDEGVELEKKTEYLAALAKYKEAEQITVTPGLRFHKGYCLEMTGKLVAALEEYEAADTGARDTNKPEVHAAAVARLEPLRRRIPQVAIRLATVAKDAEVHLDGNPVGAPLLDGKAFRVDPGEHTVTARAGGYRSFLRRVQALEGVTTTVDVVLERAHATSVVPPPPVVAKAPAPAPGPTLAAPAAGMTEPPSEIPARRAIALPLVTTIGAVALAGAGAAFFVVSGNTQTDANAECPQRVSCDGERSTVRTFDAIALGSFASAVGLGVLSAVLWRSKGSDRAALVAKPVFAGGSLGLDGSF
jgi:hypothetical protein